MTCYIDGVMSVLPRDDIATKATYVKKHNLPFDNQGHAVSVRPIKAVGTVTENAGNGRHLKINWTPRRTTQGGFLYIYRGIVWRVHPGGWRNNGLITFVFELNELYTRNSPTGSSPTGMIVGPEWQPSGGFQHPPQAHPPAGPRNLDVESTTRLMV